MTMITSCPREVRPRIRSVRAVIPAAALLAACTGGEAHPPQEVAADQPTWSVEAPVVRVGAGEQPGQALDRVYGGLLRPGGSVIIGNSGTSQLRTYDPGGRLVSATGGQGRGPGEFGTINWIAGLPGDSVLVFDLRLQRFSVWSPAGAFVRMFSSQAPPGPVRPIGVFRDGSILIVREAGYDPRAGAGAVRDSMTALRMSRTGEVAAIPGRFPGAEWLIYPHPASFRATQLPFGRTGQLAVLGDHFVYGSSDSGTLAVYDQAGRAVRRVELGAHGHGPSRKEISAFLAGIQDRAERSALARHYRNGAGDGASIFTALRGDADGNLWVRLAPRAEGDSVTWVVLAPGGDRRGSVRMATDWLPLDIRENTLLLRESDADGVQTVAVRKVSR
jgi:hypothetical protein